MIPFTYLLKHLPTNKYYYGVKFKKNCDPNDLWTKYFTSSKKVKGLIRKYGKNSFKFEIRKTFRTAKQAMNWEHKVLKRMKVIYRNDFLNQTDNKSIDPKIISRTHSGKTGFWLGKKLPKETRKKISIAKIGNKNPRYGKKDSKKMKEKRSKSIKNFYTNNVHHMLGKKLSKKIKNKMKIAKAGEKNPMYGRTGKNCPSYYRIGKKNPNYGKKFTKEHKMKISKSGIKAWERRRAA